MPLMAQLGQQQKALLMQETEASLGIKVVLLIKDMGMDQNPAWYLVNPKS